MSPPKHPVHASLDLNHKATGQDGQRARAVLRSATVGPRSAWFAIISVDGAPIGCMSGSIKGSSIEKTELAGAFACLWWMEAFPHIEISLASEGAALAVRDGMSARGACRAGDAHYLFADEGPLGADAASYAAKTARASLPASERPDPSITVAVKPEPAPTIPAKPSPKPTPKAKPSEPKLFSRDVARRLVAARTVAQDLAAAAAPSLNLNAGAGARAALACMARLALGKAMAFLRIPISKAPALDPRDGAEPADHGPWSHVRIHTDGSYKPAKARMGWGAVVTQGRVPADDAPVLALIAGGASGGGPAQAEARAIAAALESLPEHTKTVDILCDCKGILWAMRDAISSTADEILARSGLDHEVLARIHKAAEGRGVTLQWIKGHAGHLLNETADILADYGSGGAIPLHPTDMLDHPRARAALIAGLIQDQEPAKRPRPIGMGS